MQIRDNNYSIAEIKDMIDRRDLHVNRDYQRGAGLWPSAPRSYFIDTILGGFPFPKIYFYEHLPREDGAPMRLRREIVDGQQRVTTIVDFINDEFALLPGHSNGGKKFTQLEDDVQRAFLSYTVSVDVIRDATQAEIVEMFRRMNAYTLPLNDAEKRHSAYQGAFKWFSNRLSDDLGEFLIQFGVFTNRQLVRMGDQELITEVYQFTQDGITSSSPSVLKAIYATNDVNFPQADEFRTQITDAIRYIAENFPNLRRSFMMKPYAFYTLVTALIYNRYATPLNVDGVRSAGAFAVNPRASQERLLLLALSHEAKETDGPYREYVLGCLGGTNRVTQRTQRFTHVLTALQLA
ncbi:DUF262 domain-containing protein [Brevundimonas sp. BR2-1]|uniref:DUF262 domain-containing protein n=1 Tax=Brevundimonas sp. BR2-1 TaxID=3031123 RepID=UPI0030A68423